MSLNNGNGRGDDDMEISTAIKILSVKHEALKENFMRQDDMLEKIVDIQQMMSQEVSALKKSEEIHARSLEELTKTNKLQNKLLMIIIGGVVSTFGAVLVKLLIH